MSITKIFGYGLLLLALAVEGVDTLEYADCSRPFTKYTQPGRTKNSISAVISAAVAKQLYDKSKINIEIEKSLWPDATITGIAAEDTLSTNITGLWFSSVHYNAYRDEKGHFQGKVNKSEFDWNIDQASDTTYKVKRAWFKLNSELELTCRNGKISGRYIPPGLSFNWGMDGTYDDSGNVKIHVDIPFGRDIDLEGRIEKDE